MASNSASSNFFVLLIVLNRANHYWHVRSARACPLSTFRAKGRFFVIIMKKSVLVISCKLSTFRSKGRFFVISMKIIFWSYLVNYQHFEQKAVFWWSLWKNRFLVMSRKLSTFCAKVLFLCDHYEKIVFWSCLVNYLHFGQKSFFCDLCEKSFFGHIS